MNKFSISKFKIVTSFLFGGGASGVIEYVLGVLNNALDGLTETTRTKIQAALNLSLKVLSILESVRILVPTKWQTAYAKTIEAVKETVSALSDLDLTKDELGIIRDRVTAAVAAWKSPDDETCVDGAVIVGK